MAQQTIDIGAAPNDGTGDPFRDAFDKCNDNFTELYAGLTGLLDFKGSTDCSANPNYPAASKGDYYLVSVAGKIGGASGIDVAAGDSYFATADNAGGDQATVGASWTVIQGNLVVDNDTALAAESASRVPTQHAVKTYVDAQVAGAGGFTAASTTEVLTGTNTTKGATPDSLAALWEQGSDIASASTISVGEGGHFHVTGTTTITDIDPATDKAGRAFTLTFDGILTLTHNASTLILPTGANITTAAGDTARFVSEGSDVVRCVSYQRASGAALAGSSGGGYEAGPAGTVPAASAFTTWISQGTSTLTDGVGALILQVQRGAPVGRYAMIGATPSTPFNLYMRVEMAQSSQLAITAFSQMEIGFALKDNADDEIITCTLGMVRFSGDEQVYNYHNIRRMNGTNSQTISATPVDRQQLNAYWPWLRVNVTSTTITFYTSPDGKNWIQIGTETIATFVDTVDRYGLATYINDAGSGTSDFIISYFGTTAPS